MNKQTYTHSKTAKFLNLFVLLLVTFVSALMATHLLPYEKIAQAEETDATAPIDPDVIVYWKELGNFLATDFAIDPVNPANIYVAVVGAAVAVSHDYGDTWTIHADDANGDVIAIDPVNPNYVFAGGTAGVIYRSEDSGDTWEQVDGGISEGTYISELYVHPITPTLVFAGSFTGIPEVYRSDDRGATWSLIPLLSDPTNRTVRQILSHPTVSNRMFAIVQNEGIFVSEDAGLTWTNTGGSADSMTIDSNNPDVMYRLDCTPYRSTDGGMTWTELSSPQPCYDEIHIDPQDSNIVYLTSQYRRVTRSLDAGQTWQILGEEFLSGPYSSSFAIDPVETSRLYVGPGVYVSTYLNEALYLPATLR